MSTEHRPCPRCQIPNTALTAQGVAVCFNCWASWDPRDPEGSVSPPSQPAPQPGRAAPPPGPPPAPPYRFTARELARLRVYRDAVRAGFYNEGLPERRIAA